MKNLNKVIILGTAMMAVSANAQFGAASKKDFTMENGKSGGYFAYNPFTRASGGGADASGYSFSVEKLIGSKEMAESILGFSQARVDGTTLWQLSYRMYTGEDTSLQFGVYGGDGFGGKNDFSLHYWKDMPSQGEGAINFSLFGGLYRDSTDNKINLSFGVKASYPLQNSVSIDATFWQFQRGGANGNFLTLGVGYKF
jgi:hypothetical protein